MDKIIIMYNREVREEKTARMQCVTPMPKKGPPEKLIPDRYVNKKWNKRLIFTWQPDGSEFQDKTPGILSGQLEAVEPHV
jgi:hypothetical protein